MKRENFWRIYSRSYFDDICRVQLWSAISVERILFVLEQMLPLTYKLSLFGSSIF